MERGMIRLRGAARRAAVISTTQTLAVGFTVA
jgi:hypothetical protein